MKFIKPSVTLWQQEPGIEGVWKQIARATRVCYQSQQKNNETDEQFVKRVILKPALIKGDLNDLEHCKFDNLKLHGGVLEHGAIYFTVSPYVTDDKIPVNAFVRLHTNHYSKCYTDSVGFCYITTNFRVLLENNILNCLKYIVEPTENHAKRYTLSVITDIGVTREMNHHRRFSIAEQSTRYCDYIKDKFDGELTFIKPNWEYVVSANGGYEDMCARFEEWYKWLRDRGWKPEQARQVLPLGLKTQAVYTAYLDDWKHFLTLRADNTSGKAHPNMQVIANNIKSLIFT